MDRVQAAIAFAKAGQKREFEAVWAKMTTVERIVCEAHARVTSIVRRQRSK